MTNQKKALIHVIISSVLAASEEGMKRHVKPECERQYMMNTLVLLGDIADVLKPEYREDYLNILEKTLKSMGIDMFHGDMCLN